jgi:hypothetical protein
MEIDEVLTKAWVESHGISGELTLPAVADYNEPCGRTARQIAVRAVILQGVVAVGAQVDPASVMDWFREQRVWDDVTPAEEDFLANPSPTEQERLRFAWHMEAEWALLWAISKVEHLGLATRSCDSARLVDEIIPALGSDIEGFLASATLRPPGELLAEDDRTYNMWCCAQSARKENALPEDLDWMVLYERRYAFEWLDGNQEWDKVTCDA